MKKESTLVLNRVTITRGGIHSWEKIDPAFPFMATIELQGSTGKVELNLSHELSKKIVEVVASEVVRAGEETAKAMTADAMLITQDQRKALT